jgi:hypothetical protein
MDLAALQARLSDLLSLRYGGESEIETRTLDAMERVKFRSETELARAIADCERRIANIQGTRIHTVRISSSKGL